MNVGYQFFHPIDFNAAAFNTQSRFVPQYIQRAREGGPTHAQHVGNQSLFIGQMKDDIVLLAFRTKSEKKAAYALRRALHFIKRHLSAIASVVAGH